MTRRFRNRARVGATSWLAAWGLIACTGGSSNGRDVELQLATGDAARVGDAVVSLELVKRVAVAQARAPEAVLPGLIRDTLFAQKLQRSEPQKADYLRRTAFAVAITKSFLEQAKAAGPPTDDEVKHFTERNWYQLDRPEMARTVHALIVVGEGQDKAAARSVATKLQENLRESEGLEDFVQRAKAFDAGDWELKLEQVKAVSVDGQAVDPNQPPRPGQPPDSYDRDFAAAANALQTEGQVSDVVETKFGFHVLILRDRLPARQFSFEERRQLLSDEIYDARANKLQQQALERLRAEVPITVERSAVDAMGMAQVGRLGER